MINGKVNGQATDEARTYIANQRVRVELQDMFGFEFDGSRRIAAVSSATAQRLEAKHDTLIELPNPDGPSLRAWLRIDDAVPKGHCAVGASALTILGLTTGASVELRLLDKTVN